MWRGHSSHSYSLPNLSFLLHIPAHWEPAHGDPTAVPAELLAVCSKFEPSLCCAQGMLPFPSGTQHLLLPWGSVEQDLLGTHQVGAMQHSPGMGDTVTAGRNPQAGV